MGRIIQPESKTLEILLRFHEVYDLLNLAEGHNIGWKVQNLQPEEGRPETVFAELNLSKLSFAQCAKIEESVREIVKPKP